MNHCTITSKIISTVVSYFASCYVFHWNEFMKTPLLYPPTFDGRIILYPTAKEVRDYLSWRQVDCTYKYYICDYYYNY